MRDAPKGTVLLLRWRMPVLLCLFAVTAVLTAQLPKLGVDFSPQQLFETGERDADYEYWEETVEIFGRDDTLLLVVVDGGKPGAALTPPVRAWLAALSADVTGQPAVVQVRSFVDTVTVRPAPDGIAVGPAADLPAEEILADPLLVGSLVSADGRLAVAAVEINAGHRDMAQLQPAVHGVRDWIAEHPPPEGVTASLGGIPFVRVDVVESIHASRLVFLPLTGLILGLILLFSFRRISRTLLPLVCAAVAGFWGLGLMAALEVPVDIINHVLPTLIMVIAISDSLHLIVRDQEEHGRGLPGPLALSTSVRHLAIACLLTSLTTAVGFASLVISSTTILSRFGLLVAAAVLLAYLITLGMLPPLLSFAGPPAAPRPGGGPSRRLALGCGRLAIAWPKTTVAAGLVFVGLCLWLGFTRVNVDTRLAEIYGKNHPSRHLQALIDAELGGVLPMDVVIHLSEREGHADPDILARMLELQDGIETLPDVTHARSVADLLSRIHVSLVGADAGRLPDSRALAAQEWLLAEMGEEPLPLERFVADDGRRLRIMMRVADVGGSRIFETVREIETMAAAIFADRPEVEVRVTGDAHVASRNLTQLIRDLFWSLLLAGGIIFVFLLLMFRSLRLALISAVPNGFPLITLLGFMGLIRLDLDVANVIIFSVALGLAVDDTIHMLVRFREELARGGGIEAVLHRTLAGSGQAVVLTSLVLGLGLLVLTLSDFVPTQRFGYLTALTLLSAVVADLLFLPALLYLVYRGRAGEDDASPSAETPGDGPKGAPEDGSDAPNDAPAAPAAATR